MNFFCKSPQKKLKPCKESAPRRSSSVGNLLSSTTHSVIELDDHASVSASATNNKLTMTDTNKKIIQSGLDRYITVKRKRTSPRSAEKNMVKKCAKFGSDVAVTTTNRFKILSSLEDNQKSERNEANERPPPIYLRELASKELLEEIKELAENKFFIVPQKKGNIKETKIQVSSVEHYRKVINYLDENNKGYYTYQLKSAKGLIVVIKGIESNVDPSEIKKDLESQGFQIKVVSNILNWEKIPQPMFKVELEPSATKSKKGTHDIYNVRYVLYRKIVVEEPHKRKSLVQCFKCQEFGHTRSYCTLPDVCVICSAFHTTKECPADKTNPDIKLCSNCAGNHTANYKGCPVYVTLKQRLHPKQRREQVFLNKVNKEFLESLPKKSHPGVSYADALKEGLKKNEEKSSSNEAINKLTETMVNFMKTMEQNMTLMLQNMNTLMQLLIKNQK